MEKIDWKVDGMTCSNCALTISKFLQKEGMKAVKVNPIDGRVSFENPGTETKKIISGISNLGYTVLSGETGHDHDHHHNENIRTKFFGNNKKRFLFCLPFTLVLMLHMFDRWLSIGWLMNPWLQLALCIPVFIVGMDYFGRSAINSLRNGVPNMNVLITLGAASAFIYSLTGAILGLGHNYLFFETAASIITLVFLGNYLEDVSIKSTQRAIKSLAKSQKVMANMIAFDDKHEEHIFPVENIHLKTGDLVLIKVGEPVPVDCKILWGECRVNESIITGESVPVQKGKKDFLIGGSVLDSGVVKAQVTAVGDKTVLSGILKMVQDAQGEKPPVQKMADKISAVFVPVVLVIATGTLLANYFLGSLPFGDSVMRAVAVLVIACPCAMGLATPAAIAVGLGRAAKSGILFRNASSLESFRDIRQVVFDKTGTLTTGTFAVSDFQTNIDEKEFMRIASSLEKYSNHPIGKSIFKAWPESNTIRWKHIEEIKGLGIKATDTEGNHYRAGSADLLEGIHEEKHHNVYIFKNEQLLGWIDVEDEIRPEAAAVVEWLKKKGIKTFLLTGDKNEKAERVGKKLGIENVLSEQKPEQKLQKIAELNAEFPTAMIGDGINDAPALAKATLGISLSDAAHIAMQSSDVILVNNGLQQLPAALGLGKHTYKTIKENLFWAFIYNIVAIPIAAFGLLTPTFAALAMGLSDVVLAINSGRLFVKKVV